MGNWNINIQGVGAHHNANRDDAWRQKNDADVQFRQFVKALEAAGHTIEHATFTHGAKEEICPTNRAIFVNTYRFSVPSTKLSGAQIKAVGGISPTYSLFLETPGGEKDRQISDGEAVNILEDGNRFYGVPPATF